MKKAKIFIGLKSIVTVVLITFCFSSVIVNAQDGVLVNWDFENGNDHGFNLHSLVPATPAADDTTVAGDEALTGGYEVGNPNNLPEAGAVWIVGSGKMYNGLKPGADSAHANLDANGLMVYREDKNRIGWRTVGSLNTFLINNHGDFVHADTNDQIASSPKVTLPANALLSVVSSGGGGDIAPEFDSDPTQGYATESSGIAVLSAADSSLLASLYLHNKGNLGADTLDLSSLAGQEVFIEVVDAFEGGWGWLAVDEIQIGTEAIGLPELKSGKCMLIVSNAATLVEADEILYDGLGVRGYTVTPVASSGLSSLVQADFDKYDFMVASESIGSGDLGPIKTMPLPLVNLEGWAVKPGALDWQVDKVVTNDTPEPVKIVDDTGHPLAAGFANRATVTLVTDLTNGLIVSSIPQIPIIPIATLSSDPTKMVVYGIPEGTLNTKGIIMMNRVATIGIHAYGYPSMTDDAWKFIIAAIDWTTTGFKAEIVAHWKFEDNANDELGTSDGTLINGDASLYVDGVSGKAIDFGAGNDSTHILVPDNPIIDFDSTMSFTISTLVKVDPISNTDEIGIAMKGWYKVDPAIGGEGKWYLMAFKNGEARFMVDDNVTKTQLGVKIAEMDVAYPVNQWAHLVGVRDLSENLLKLYLNGVSIGSKFDATYGDISSPTLPLIIGGDLTHSRNFQGQIDDLRMYNYALSDDDVQRLFESYGIEPLSLVGHWKFDDASGITAADEFGTSDGTLVNMTGSEWATGKVGTAINMAAGNDSSHILVPDNDIIDFDSTTSFTISTLVKVDPISYTDEIQVLFKGGTSVDTAKGWEGKWYTMAFKNKEIRFAVDDNVNKTQLGVKIADMDVAYPVNEWAHLVGVRDLAEDSLKLYLNAKLIGSIFDATDGDISSSGVPLIIGNGQNMNRNFKGQIDDLRMYDYALSPGQIEKLFKSYGIIPPVNVDEDVDGLPLVYALKQNYPNPFNPTTTIEFQLKNPGHTTISVYNALGQLVTTLVDGNYKSGFHQVTFRADNYSSGIYFYRIQSGDFTKARKMLLLK